MTEEGLERLLEQVKEGVLSVEEACRAIRERGYADLGFAHVDVAREKRCGFPEVIFCEGKTPVQVARIAEEIYRVHGRLLATRADGAVFDAVRERIPGARYNETARTVSAAAEEIPRRATVHLVTGGTSDMPVAEEAVETARIMGCSVKTLYDVGVAGVHRLLGHTDFFADAEVVIAVAGMEGALPSVVGGLVDCPVIAVPTSVGYGAGFHGVAALLGMLNSCAPNVLVTNIDSGFRAGYTAALIAGGRVRGGEDA